MKTMIRIPAVIILQLFFCTARGNSSDTLIVENDTTIAAGTDSSLTTKKICSCQLMSVRTGKYEKELVGIFAEKTPEGKITTNYRLMDELIRRESIYFRIAYTQSAVLKETIKAETDCRSLYRKLKSGNNQLRLYNILDADILATLAKR